MSVQKRKNIFLTDEDVNGPAIELARTIWGVEIVRAVDVGLARTDDQTVFDYARERDYVLVSGNIKHHEPKFYQFAESGRDHPGLILIRKENRSSSYYTAEWLALCADENMTNRILRI